MAMVECTDCKEMCDFRAKDPNAPTCWCCRLIRDEEQLI